MILDPLKPAVSHAQRRHQTLRCELAIHQEPIESIPSSFCNDLLDLSDEPPQVATHYTATHQCCCFQLSTNRVSNKCVLCTLWKRPEDLQELDNLIPNETNLLKARPPVASAVSIHQSPKSRLAWSCRAMPWVAVYSWKYRQASSTNHIQNHRLQQSSKKQPPQSLNVWIKY